MPFVLRNKDKYKDLSGSLKSYVSYHPQNQSKKKGKWIDKSGGIDDAWNYCSVCGEQAIDLYDYCPNCGANMKGKQDE